MTLTAGVGLGRAVDGREAGLQAAHQALDGLGILTPAIGLLFASNHYAPRDVVNGALSLLGDTPLIGFSTPAGITSAGPHPNSVVLALLAGNFEARSHWFPGYSQSSRETAQRLTQMLAVPDPGRALLFFADGFSGDAEQFCEEVRTAGVPTVGVLSSGELQTGTTFQLAGNQSGVGSLAAAMLQGDIRIGIGYGHGWDPVGSQFRITRSRGFWLRTLNGRPASEAYAELFGQPAGDWAYPPLSYLARLYPLGIEQDDQLLVRSPIRVEADGSFRMNAPLRDGEDAYLLVGSRAACRRAAAQAAQQALLSLGGLRPSFALVLTDISWQLLLESSPGIDVEAVTEILGTNVPVAGGYTLGQIVPQTNQPSDSSASLRFLNQHIVVVVFAEGHPE